MYLFLIRVIIRSAKIRPILEPYEFCYHEHIFLNQLFLMGVIKEWIERLSIYFNIAWDRKFRVQFILKSVLFSHFGVAFYQLLIMALQLSTMTFLLLKKSGRLSGNQNKNDFYGFNNCKRPILLLRKILLSKIYCISLFKQFKTSFNT